MSDWLLNLPVVWMAVVIFGAAYLFAAALYRVITTLASGERARVFKAFSPGMLPPRVIVFCAACRLSSGPGLKRRRSS